MRPNRWRSWLAGASALAMVLCAGCGPGVGGTGTGAAAFVAFQASAASVCEGAIAAELACPPPPGAAGPVPTGTQPVRFVDAAGQVTLEVNGNTATLDAACLRLRFSGEFGIGTGNVQGFFGSYRLDAVGVDVLAALTAAVASGGGALAVELRDAEARVVIGPVLLQRTTAAPPAPSPC